MNPRYIGGSLQVDDVARLLRGYQYAEVRLMEAQAGWLAYIPPYEVKIELSYFLFDDACHADALRKRLPGLRDLRGDPAPPHPNFVTFCHELTNTRDLVEQMTGLFWVLKPRLLDTYRWHMRESNSVLDAPTIRILRQIMADEERHIAWGDELLRELTAHTQERAKAIAWRDHLNALLNWAGGLTGEGAGNAEHPPVVIRDGGEPHRLRKEPPVRDSRFRVATRTRREGRAATDVWDRESLLDYFHAMVTGEMEAMEICGRSLFDFPDMPWDFRFLLAQQLWDEARHTEMSLQRYFELGGTLDRLPVSDEFRLFLVPIQHDDLARRLVFINQIIEGWVMDDFEMVSDICRAMGDERTAEMFDFLQADEWVHIKIGGDWIPWLTQNDPAYREAVINYRVQEQKRHEARLQTFALDAMRQRVAVKVAREREAHVKRSLLHN